MKDLIERLEKATGPDSELDDAIAVAVGKKKKSTSCESCGSFSMTFVQDYTRSLDAALTLWPQDSEWSCVFGFQVERPIARAWHRDMDEADMGAAHSGATIAIAVCIAALKSRERQ